MWKQIDEEKLIALLSLGCEARFLGIHKDDQPPEKKDLDSLLDGISRSDAIADELDLWVARKRDGDDFGDFTWTFWAKVQADDEGSSDVETDK